MEGEVDFLPADKHKSFLQNDSIILSACSQTCPKYQKQKFYNIFPISQGNCAGWRFFPGWWMWKASTHLGVCGQACPNYQK